MRNKFERVSSCVLGPGRAKRPPIPRLWSRFRNSVGGSGLLENEIGRDSRLRLSQIRRHYARGFADFELRDLSSL